MGGFGSIGSSFPHNSNYSQSSHKKDKITLEGNPNGQSEEFNIGRPHFKIMIIMGQSIRTKSILFIRKTPDMP